MPSLSPVCRCKEASGFLECTKGHTLGFHPQLWTCPCAIAPHAGTGQATKVVPINRKNQQGLKIQSSGGASEAKKDLSGLGHATAPGLYRSSVGEFSAAPRYHPEHPTPTGKVSCPEGAPEGVFQHFMSEYMLC